MRKIVSLLLIFALLSCSFSLISCSNNTNEPDVNTSEEVSTATEPSSDEPETTEPSGEETTEAVTTEQEEKPVWETHLIACLGDSLTNLGNGYDTYVDYLGSETFPLTTQNVGLSGSAMGISAKSGANSPLSKRYLEISSKADIILVFGGSNDFGHTQFPVTLGDVNGEDVERTTFCGAVRFLISKLAVKYPNAMVVFVTPLVRNQSVWMARNGGDPNQDYNTNEFGYTLIDYRNAMITICEKYQVPVIDAYAFSEKEMNPLKEDDLNMYFLDGLHLKTAGARKLASWLTDQVESIWNEKH